MQLGYLGLGKMGLPMVLRLQERGQEIIAYNRSEVPRKEAAAQGITVADSLSSLVSSLETPRTVWLMVSHQGVDEVLDALVPLLEKGDTIIEGGNSPYKETMRRANAIEAKGIDFLDIGVSGGPGGARNGACLMIGGRKKVYERYIELYKAAAAPDAYAYFGASGAGHFVKMVHNGIEYGMMQALAEGFTILKQSSFDLNVKEVARLYNHQSVITSRLVGWLENAYKEEGEDLEVISGEVSHSGEGQWTVEAAKEMGIDAPIIEGALNFRKDSQGHPSYTGKVLSALRNQFGGHEVKKK